MRRRGSTRRRPGCRGAAVFSAVDGTVQQIYFRPGEMVPAGRPVLSLLPPGNVKVRFYVPETVLPTHRLWRRDQGRPAMAAPRSHCAGQLHRQAVRVHAAGDLQPRGARQARVSDRGAAGKARRAARRPAGRRHARPPANACATAAGVAMSATAGCAETARDDRHRRARPDQIVRRPRRSCATCRCRSSAARSSASSAPTAPARPRPSACCAAC